MVPSPLELSVVIVSPGRRTGPAQSGPLLIQLSPLRWTIFVSVTFHSIDCEICLIYTSSSRHTCMSLCFSHSSFVTHSSPYSHDLSLHPHYSPTRLIVNYNAHS